MKTIFKTIYGSHLYGTNVPTSDTDIKGIFIPTAQSILLGEIPSTFTNNSNSDSKRKNTSSDTDYQLFSLKKFMHDLANGQTYALEFLFSPKDKWLEEPHGAWLELLSNKDKLISKNVTAMVSYARAQAYKYGDKGKRLEVFRDVVNFLEETASRKFAKLNSVLPIIQELIIKKHKDFISIHKKENDESGVEYLDVNGVMVPVASSIEYALDVYKPRLEEYGARAKKAMEDRGNDLKAIYHAVRIAKQAEELLLTGNITLPRPESSLLIEIRKGEVPDLEMKQIVDDSFDKVRTAEKNSSLPNNTDKKWAKDFLMRWHLNSIKFWYNDLPEIVQKNKEAQ